MRMQQQQYKLYAQNRFSSIRYIYLKFTDGNALMILAAGFIFEIIKNFPKAIYIVCGGGGVGISYDGISVKCGDGD